MSGRVDLHCHFLPAVDDGAPDLGECLSMLRALSGAGFEHVVATPHMRPGMFDNDRAGLTAAWELLGPVLAAESGLPATALSSEHYFDDVVLGRLLAGEGLPYPGGRAVLVELYETELFPWVQARLFDLARQGLTPVIAHPERYRTLWRDPSPLERLVDGGCGALLDVAALVGKYGREPQRCAEHLLGEGLYHAACTDAHRARDVDAAVRGIDRLRALHGAEEVEFLFETGPRELLAGRVPE
ncbi:MAG: protein tyrosine phosphatase [Polyangiaceae bacterium]|nr:protein tyrosine phosphatase [Polyangiaceae bacterium]